MMAAAAFVFIYYTTWALLLVRFALHVVDFVFSDLDVAIL